MKIFKLRIANRKLFLFAILIFFSYPFFSFSISRGLLARDNLGTVDSGSFILITVSPDFCSGYMPRGVWTNAKFKITPLPGYTGGVFFGVRIKKINARLLGGIQYTQKGYLYTDLSSPINNSGEYFVGDHRFEFWEIPIKYQQNLKIGKIDFFISLGIAYNKFVWGTFIDPQWGPIYMQQPFFHFFPLKENIYSFHGGLGYNLKLNNKMKLQISPEARIISNPRISYYVPIRIYSVGLNFGLIYFFSHSSKKV